MSLMESCRIVFIENQLFSAKISLKKVSEPFPRDFGAKYVSFLTSSPGPPPRKFSKWRLAILKSGEGPGDDDAVYRAT